MPDRVARHRRAPASAEARLACPVCIGTVMVKLRPAESSSLLLDHCGRCGGVWFDRGEVPALRACRPEALWAQVSLRPEAYRMKCHRCQAAFGRDKTACPACGWEAVLRCPRCRKPMRAAEQDGLRLDACAGCQGVWFDNTELAEVWNRKVKALAPVRGASPSASIADVFLLDALLWHPHGAGDLAAGGALVVGEAVGGAAQVAGGAIEATGELAGSVFDSLADVIGSVLEGLGDLLD